MTSRSSLRVLGVSTTAALALFVAACGSSNSSSSSSSSGSSSKGTSAQAPAAGKKGGVLKQLGSSDVDYLDPGHTYYTGGYQFAYAIGRPLYGFKPGQTQPVPDTADGMPQISSDNKTVTVKIKPGIKFGPPVNRAMTSKDVAYAIDRAFSANVGNEYATAYFGSIEGAPTTPTKGVKTISGVQTPDDSTLVLKLSKPQAVGVAAALVMPISIPVPESYAAKFDAKSPSTYNTHVVASGAYMIPNTASGTLTGYNPGKSIKLVRNPNWDAKTDFKPAYLDEIDATTNSDASVSAEQILKGQGLDIDANPPANVLEEAVKSYPGQFASVPAGGYRYFPMNTTIKPFDNVNVRKAVIAAFDRNAALKARGGKFTGAIPSHFLPPDFPGFDEAGGQKGPNLDFMQYPNGNMALAEKYMKMAGYPSGKYTGKEQFLIVGATADPVKAQTQVAAAQFAKLGFNMKVRSVPQDAVYTQYCQVPPKKVAVCGGSGWFKDFQDPASMLEPTFKGSLIAKEQGNNNLAQLNDPKIDAAMDKADLLAGDARLKAFGQIDDMITADAPAVPFDWDKTTLIWSKNVSGVINDYYTTVDFNYTSLK